jgi:polynucleotide 5'-hydroxyl-kinase GRC3/NOL9
MGIPSNDVTGPWSELDLCAMRGVILIVGSTDTGKSTLARQLFCRLAESGQRVAVLDGDPGQSNIGPPTTMTLGVSLSPPAPEKDEPTFSPKGPVWRHFVGGTTPSGRMLPIVVGAGRLVRAALRAGAETVLYDTTGLVEPDRGGLYLKLAKIDLLEPSTVIALGRRAGGGSVEPPLGPLIRACRRRSRPDVIELPVSQEVRTRSRQLRQTNRARRFQSYFAGCSTLTVHWPSVAVLPTPRFDRTRLVSLEDDQGFVIALATVEDIDSKAREVTLRTPATSMEGVDAIRIGEVGIDPATFRDHKMSKP